MVSELPTTRQILLILSAIPLWLMTSGCQRGSEAGGEFAAAPDSGGKAGKLSFNFDVRPILSDKCFACHGPDAANNKAGLRLDQAEFAYRAPEGSEAIPVVPGNAQASELVKRIFSEDRADIMPPPESHLSLTGAEKEILKRWVDEGAEYEKHWAFQKLPAEVSVADAGKLADWTRQPLDSFIARRLMAEALEPAAEAATWKWLRRVTLDLTGLPPGPGALARLEQAIESEGREQAYADEVDRLLGSPRYGERMAVPWLDAARYADSYGYQSDQLSVSWPYRDWVIRAFNENMPYDRFLVANLAGDLMPDATRDDRLATHFNRLHRMTNEGGSIAEEFRIEYAADRVHTMGTAVLGLTLECARCHDHKYDPIPMDEYYSTMAFFDSIDENGLYDHPAKIPSPSMLLPDEQQEQRLNKARERLAQLEGQTAALEAAAMERFGPWLASVGPEFEWTSLIGSFSFEEEKGDLANQAPGAKQHAKRGGLPLVDGIGEGLAVALDGDKGVTIPGFFHADRWDPATHAMWIRDTVGDSQPVVVMQRTFGTDVGYNGYDLMLEGGRLAARWYRVWPGNAIGVETRDALIKPGEWTHVAWTYDGSSRAGGIRIFVDGHEVETKVLRDGPMVKSVGVRTFGHGNYTLGQRFRDRGFAGGEIDEFRVFNRALSPIEVSQLHDGRSLREKLAERDKAALREYFLAAVDSGLGEHRQALLEARRELVAAENAVLEVAVMHELEEPRETYLLERGEYHSPAGEPLAPRTLSALPPMADDLPRNRLGLARWLTNPSHPLTARVFVNRIWQQFFGQGLVSTPDNFGLQGALPSHPDLLDWLARDFVDHGWDVKRLSRQLVLSATYRQDSVASPELRERDPANQLLARGPSHRLSAEIIRDSALAVSGLLDETLGGPPVSPYQPGKDLWRESNGMSPPYRQSVGKALHRRSLYSVWKRTAPLPNMLIFDATPREVCVVKRERTSTPLQALVLLNDIQFVEAARAMAERFTQPEGLDMSALFACSAGRAPRPTERQLLSELFTEQLQHFEGDPDAAVNFMKSTGLAEPDATNAPQLAAATVVAQAVLNLDASIWKR